MAETFAAVLYLVSGVLFILALRGLSHTSTSRRGNLYGIVGMGLAIAATLFLARPSFGALLIIILGFAIGGGAGSVIAKRIAMTAVPQLVSAFHSLIGSAAVMVAAAVLYAPEAVGIGTMGAIRVEALVEMSIGVAIGALTVAGSVVAFLKLDGRMSGKPLMLPQRHLVNIALGTALVLCLVGFTATGSHALFWLGVILALALGVLLIVPIGAADMPVVLSMLNSCSGWAAASIGFMLQNLALIIAGALVGSSGAILSHITCKGMNRSFVSVILGGPGGETAGAGGTGGGSEDRTVKQGSAEDAAFLLKNATRVIVVLGPGTAMAQARHALREMADILKKQGVAVSCAIRPAAGRLPGHMNVLLAEAGIPSDDVIAIEDIDSELARTDVSFVIGANDVTDPAARDDHASPLFRMPTLNVNQTGICLLVKRSTDTSTGTGYAGIDDTPIYEPDTMMLVGDARTMVEAIARALTH